MKKIRKAISILLVALLILQVFPLNIVVFADTGSTTTQHQTTVPIGYTGIYTKEQLNNARNNLSGNYILMNDIEFTTADFQSGGAYYTGGAGWLPIGTDSLEPFTGVFDGNGYVIKKLYINSYVSNSFSYVGFLGYCGGSVKNLGMVDVSINATATTSVNAGGIAGYSSGIITNCYNVGIVSATSTSTVYAGGIVGCNAGTLTSCYNTSGVCATVIGTSSTAYAGGIVGCNVNTISNCYNLGSVSSAKSSFSTYAGGIVGYIYSGTITNCYYINTISKGIGFGTGTTIMLTLEQMKQQSNFVGFDFTNTWVITQNSKYLFPTLKTVAHIEKDDDTINFTGGNGTIYNPYQIKTKEQLNNARNYLNSSYILLNDIEFTTADFQNGGAYYNGGVGWLPIGTDEIKPFSGVFDGNGFVIKNLYINSYSSNSAIYAGLIGYSSGTVKKLGILNDSLIATTSYYSAYAGGIVGYSSGTISRCYNTGSVSATSSDYTYAGGIVGYSRGAITSCYNTGSISATSHTAYAGGIVGYSGEIITNCYNLGSVSASTNSISSASYAGGIVGISSGGISNCYNIGFVSATATGQSKFFDAGGIVGYKSGGTISNCYYLETISRGIGSGIGTTVMLTLEQMKQQSNFVGFDFTNIWVISQNSKYLFPTLKTVAHIEKDDDVINFAGGNGTTYNPYQIKTKEQLNNSRYYLYSSFVLLNDIEFTTADFQNGGAYNNGGAAWLPIGMDASKPFSGIFDGNGFVIKKLYINSSSYAGLFGFSSGTIKNLGMFDGCISATASSYANVGGIVGYNTGTISNCYNTGSVSAESSSSAYVGGIVGYNKGTINNCYNTGDASSTAYAGGIIGYNISIFFDAISNCYNFGSVTITGTSSEASAGGIVGFYPGISMSNCYYLDNISKGIGTGRGDVSVKLTLEQMKQQSSYAGFDFTNTWGIANNSLPYLKCFPYAELISLNFDKNNINLSLNKTANLKLNINPTNPSFLVLTYSSLNPSIATVDNNGVISGKAVGTTSIIVTDIITGMTTKCDVAVTDVTLGDINGDGKINTLDALKALQAASGKITLNDTEKQAADVNNDGQINTLDALKILQYASGKITSF